MIGLLAIALLYKLHFRKKHSQWGALWRSIVTWYVSMLMFGIVLSFLSALSQ